MQCWEGNGLNDRDRPDSGRVSQLPSCLHSEIRCLPACACWFIGMLVLGCSCSLLGLNLGILGNPCIHRIHCIHFVQLLHSAANHNNATGALLLALHLTLNHRTQLRPDFTRPQHHNAVRQSKRSIPTLRRYDFLEWKDLDQKQLAVRIQRLPSLLSKMLTKATTSMSTARSGFCPS